MSWEKHSEPDKSFPVDDKIHGVTIMTPIMTFSNGIGDKVQVTDGITVYCFYRGPVYDAFEMSTCVPKEIIGLIDGT